MALSNWFLLFSENTIFYLLSYSFLYPFLFLYFVCHTSMFDHEILVNDMLPISFKEIPSACL